MPRRGGVNAKQNGMTHELLRVQHRGISVRQVLEWSKADYGGDEEFGRSKLSNINALINDDDLAHLADIGGLRCSGCGCEPGRADR